MKPVFTPWGHDKSRRKGGLKVAITNLDSLRNRTTVRYEDEAGSVDSEVMRFTRTTLLVGDEEYRTLRGRIVGSPAAIWKKYYPQDGSTRYEPWPFINGKRYLRTYLRSRRHGILTLLLPPSAATELEKLGDVTNREVVISMVNRGSYSHATFRALRRRLPRAVTPSRRGEVRRLANRQ